MGCGITFICFKLVVIFLEFTRQSVKAVPSTQFGRIIDYDQLRNVVFLKSGKIILAGDRMLHKLGDDLSVIQEKSMCDPDCQNINKICLAREEHGDFIICGTTNDGFCEMRYIENLSEVSTNKTLPKIPNQPHIHSVALIKMNGKMLLGYNTTDTCNITYKITDKEHSSLSPVKEDSLGSDLCNTTKPFIYFKKALPDILKKNRNYFLIHERSTTNYNSKMVIKCESGFTRVNINCTRDNQAYNLIQDADIFDTGTPAGIVFVGAFVSSDKPLSVSVSGDSVVCIQKLNLIDQQMNTSTCSDKNQTADVLLNSSYLLPKSEGFVTAIKMDNGPLANMSVVYIGTSKGRFIQTYLTSLGEPLQSFSSRVVQEGSPVVTMKSYNNGNGTYVVTGKKIAWYLSTNCESYKTCNEMTKAQNPFCGWCIFQGRSTARSGCTSSWRSMVDPCSSISVSLGAQRVGERQQLRIQTENFPLDDIQSGDNFTCRLSGKKQSGSVAAYNSTTKHFTCTIQETEHQTTTLEVVGTISGKEFLVGAIEYLIYKCELFKRCGQCTDNRIQCQWCSESCHDSCLNMTVCPKLADREIYVPNGFDSNVTFYVDIPNEYSVSCYALSISKPCPCTSNGTSATCSLKINMTDHNTSKQDLGIVLKYGPTSPVAELDKEINVTVYRCDLLAYDCTHCQALNSSRYQCHWDNTTGTCVAGPRTEVQCPSATITEISPKDAPEGGNTNITIIGTNFPSGPLSATGTCFSTINCTSTQSNSSDFEWDVVDRIICRIVHCQKKDPCFFEFVQIESQQINVSRRFDCKIPNITSISPTTGSRSGGTLVTFSGTNLQVGNRKIKLRYNNAVEFDNCVAVNISSIVCTVPLKLQTDMKKIEACFDVACAQYFNLNFTLTEDPVVDSISSTKTILSGGTLLYITGQNLTNAHSHKIVVSYNGHIEDFDCENVTSTSLQCRFPPTPQNVKSDLDIKLNQLNQSSGRRRKRDATCPCTEVSIIVKLDGYEKIFSVEIYSDPKFDSFTGVKKMERDERYIVLEGTYLDLVLTSDDYLIKVGDAQCTVLNITSTTLTCQLPDNLKDGSKYSVIVNVGKNYRRDLGYLQYDVMKIYTIVTIAAIVLGVLVGSFILVGSVMYGRYFKLKRKKRLLEQRLHSLEMEIISVARQEFAEMANGMSFVNRMLVNHGLPFHGYQQYAFNMMFSAEQVLIDKMLYQGQPGNVKQSVKKGLDNLEKLILNKMFLVSLVSTMEKEKRFFLKERANLSGNLCAILMGKMGYLNEVLQDLLMCLVQESVLKKKHKTLFRRCETITENLLRNWLALTIYPHLKASSGSPLYLLFMAMQLTIENGPIDAITGDAKFTLSEDKLLRRWQPIKQEDSGVHPEVKHLTMKVIVDDGDQVFDCKVLDCDTISQVKSKCLSQIYVNYPASQLAIYPEETLLNWHAGHTTSLTLRDVDNTNIKAGNLLRLNTLAHYNVGDNANLALVDPKTLEDDYMNIKNNSPGLAAKDDTALLSPVSGDVESPEDSSIKWHLVKAEEDENAQNEPSAIDELYLNKLFTTKQSINAYITTLFDHILNSEQCSPPVKFVFDYMDILANKFKIDENTILAWKSQSYAVRIWGRMIRQPTQLFDVTLPQYVGDSLDVVAQVLEDSLASTEPKVSKDSPGHKLVFYSEVQRYRQKAKEFQKGLQAKGEQSNILTDYLGDLNKMQQQQQNFNKMAYLQKFFDQIFPYLNEIVEGLSANKETKELELDIKMREVIDLMN